MNIQSEFLKMRGYYYNICEENFDKYKEKYNNHPLYNISLRYMHGSLKDVFEIAKELEKEYIEHGGCGESI